MELHAYALGWRPDLLDVGHRGFGKPVTLILSYAYATGLTGSENLSIVHLVDGDAPGEQLVAGRYGGPDPRYERALVARLDHFSGYAVAAE